MKFPIEQHEQMLRNAQRYLASQEQEHERRTRQLEVQRRQVAFYKKQIEEARRQGKDGFDADRFMGGRDKAGA